MTPTKLKEIPPNWEKLHRASARRLIQAEAKSIVAMRTSARSIHHELLGKLQSQSRTTALLTLGRVRDEMATEVAAQVEEARKRAREAAISQVQAELAFLTTELKRLGYHHAPFGELSRTDEEADKASADPVAHSLASAWAQAVLVFLINAKDDSDIDVATRARNVMQTLDKRIARIAATESAMAFSDQHEDSINEALGTDDKDPTDPDDYADYPKRGRPRWLFGVFRCWSALLDRRTCKECEARDGDIVPIGMKFKDGDEPGDMHPLCRCVDTIVFLPMYAGEEEDNSEDGGDDPDESAAA